MSSLPNVGEQEFKMKQQNKHLQLQKLFDDEDEAEDV